MKINENILLPSNIKIDEGYLIVRPECIEFKKMEDENMSSIEILIQNHEMFKLEYLKALDSVIEKERTDTIKNE